MRNCFSCTKPYISEEYYQNLKNYKYRSSDASITYKYCMSPLCNYLVEKFPKWLAPNVITVSGFFLNILYFSVTSYYTKLKGGEIPSWACFFSAFCYLIYQILDNIDGKQARRTNSSSPLGLLVDHGTDSCTTFFITCGLGSILALNTIQQFILLWIMIIVPFYLNNWEQYVTGEMNLPFINGINEGTYIIFFLECLVGFKGQNFLTDIKYEFFGKSIQFNTFISSLACCAGIFFGLLSISKIFNLESSTKMIEALIDVFPFIYFLLGFFSIVYLTDSEYVREYPQLLLVTFGFQFAKMLGLLQLSHLIKARYNPYSFVFVMPNLCFIIHSLIYYFTKKNKILFVTIDNLILFFLIFNFISWLHFAYYCSEELCVILNIKRFSLGKRNEEERLGEISEVPTREISDII